MKQNSNRSSYCDWAKFKLINRQISRIRAKASMPSLAIWKRRWVYRIPRWERRRVYRVLRLLSRARWVYRISWLLRAKTSISSLASRAKMSMSSLVFGERRRVCRVLRFWDYNIIRCCDACLVDGICFHCVCINIGWPFLHFPSKQILLFHWLMSSHCLHFPN